ncbi:PREDICTED: putative speedy protein E8 [Cercocebus atys]|uniref:putative speedy protein E8 n=1 Tax=Cercocebus atys TaxID=9531 RepID=UPI0005F363C2|nr:PREDICTED: putative speedy protein E8 [Cercocebus atys]
MFCGMEQILGKITTLLPEDKEESPRSNTSEYSLQEVVDDEVSGPSGDQLQKHYTLVWFLYSALGVDPSPSCRSLCWKRKREWLDQSDEEPEKELAPEPEETWVAETLCGLKMKLKRRRVSLVLPEHHEAFNRLLGRRTPQRAPPILFFLKRGNFQYFPPGGTLLLAALMLPRKPCPASHADICSLITEDPVIKRFLAWDKDLRMSDKYLLAMVIAYFSRAGLFSWQYQRIHFFLALYLANDMEEDSETPKQNIIYFLYRKNRSQIPSFHKRRFQFFYSMRSGAEKKPSQKALFHKLRFQFFHSMRCRAWVSLEELEEIQAYDPEHWVWARDRATFRRAPGTMEA